MMETHSDWTDEAEWRKEWGGEVVLSHKSTTSGGAGVLFWRRLAPQTREVEHVVDGRLLQEPLVPGPGWTSRTTQHRVWRFLRSWAVRLTEAEVEMLQEDGRGEEAPDATEPFPDPGCVPRLSGSRDHGADRKLLDFNRIKGKEGRRPSAPYGPTATVGEAKLAVYTSRKNRVEGKRLSPSSPPIRARRWLDFKFFFV